MAPCAFVILPDWEFFRADYTEHRQEWLCYTSALFTLKKILGPREPERKNEVWAKHRLG
jgi:hypothetical protein